jgi:hypothetical protein
MLLNKYLTGLEIDWIRLCAMTSKIYRSKAISNL